MKHFIIAFSALLLAACAGTPPPTSMLDSDWTTFGYERAMKGQIAQSESRLDKLLEDQSLKSSNYQAYLTGYKKGQNEYCSQNAYILGVTGGPYNGICDLIDWTFREDYNSGRFSTANGM
ncbi:MULTISPECIES: DUF2799 domain-containing protein [Aliivibrio]|uniref:Lipoprotein, putative n=2 Tax=Aliivibrio fischeri TaxID=668 RepID=B5FDQ5_ALIFM|nr:MULTISPECIES: DUF2799 domain-containing protein [Aliivibrio]ACH66389.1 lipoprotein, putative [Aliivibrio fischeri MJ11]MBD1570198.1 DUF2799 domain-containing protein [Aliivibrio sp. S10_S31]MCE4934300.1 DUF2799 domain-containing protein [Aliivibrio fischeri]MUH95075.1 DUF2799 domain-containing protein [Aliivibrio fischeri]MUI65237.1 DUF2799 domain-containing protein [Aliivibrio fischeri]